MSRSVLMIRASRPALTVPASDQIVVGTKDGRLSLYDVSSSTLISEVQAHSGAVWSLQVRPDKKGLVSGSADKDVKFWDFEMLEVDEGATTQVDRLGVTRVVSIAACPPLRLRRPLTPSPQHTCSFDSSRRKCSRSSTPRRSR
jgi:WD40 repeat protein